MTGKYPETAVEFSIDKRYPIDADADRAWRLLCDMPAVAICMPGAELTDQVDENRYKGKAKVKVGPAIASFGGEIEMLQIDQEVREVRMSGKGADKGGSFASLLLIARIEPAESDVASVLVGRAEVSVKGKFAQYGERMMIQIADMMIGQFADNFSAAASALPSCEAAARGALPTDISAIRDAIPGQNRELNALVMLWRLVKAWFRGLLGKGR